MKLDINSVEKQTRFLPLLANALRMCAILGFSLGLVFGAIVLFGDHPASVDEYGNPEDDTLVRGLGVMIGGIGNGAICLILASLLDSLRSTAMNSAKAASLASNASCRLS